MQANVTCGILKRRSRLATCTEVTEDAAPTTPDITLRTAVALHAYSASSMLLIEPGKHKRANGYQRDAAELVILQLHLRKL